MCDQMAAGGIGIALERASPLSDGFCVVKRITPGGPVVQAMNDPMEKYVGCGSAIGCCESMTCRAMICPAIKSRDT